MSDKAPILVLDFGSQYTQLITRRVRELGFASVLLPGSASLERIQSSHARAVILSGGPASVYEAGAPRLPEGFWEFQLRSKLPVLGICYGMQLLARDLGGEVSEAKHREYGRMRVIPRGTSGDAPFVAPFNAPFNAWMSHGDETAKLPQGFGEVARSESGALAWIENPARRIAGLQFHPEVSHTERGAEVLQDFLGRVAGLTPNWDMKEVLDEQIARIQSQVGPEDHVLCALSGGVDSAVAAVLVHRAIGERLHCVFVDHGLLRLDEQARVMKLFRDELSLPVTCVDASERFLKKLQGVSDPERKRKIIGAEFIAVFDEAATKLTPAPRYLVQGTLYPDVIESSPGHQHSVTIKSHHNVGGLPKDMKFKLIEPLRELFKDEVRALGKILGVPQAFLGRHPFPGPGLAVRVMGEITPEALRILREVDEIFIEALKRSGLYAQVWQAFAVFLPIRSVGVQGDGRTHDHVVALRAVSSSDGMTADWARLDAEFLAQVSSEICNRVKGVNRVVYDISSKPPATIEWE